MGATDKLTKKQKKSLAFHERKGKGRANPDDDTEANAVPVAENQALAEVLAMEDEENDEPPEGDDAFVVQGKGKKRKREENNDSGEDAKPKKQKGRAGEAVSSRAGGEGAGDTEGKKTTKTETSKADVKQQRFILFVGNLKYTTTREAVQEHFKACGIPPPTVRLTTPKPSETSKPTIKSKGFAFLEFVNKTPLQQALKLHQSQLEGRNINVELTAGGGGKSESRLAKVKTRNKELHDQRVKQLKKHKSSGSKQAGGDESDIQLDRPQRYSATSGVDQVPATKRTWTVGTTPEEDVKQKKKRGKKPPRSQGTGVNAIPVG